MKLALSQFQIVTVSKCLLNLVLYLTRYKYNVSIREINQAVVKSILEAALEDRNQPKQAMVQNLEKVIHDDFYDCNIYDTKLFLISDCF